jgi:HEAT repeat protein
MSNRENFGLGLLEFTGYREYIEKLKEGAENVRAISAFALGQIGDDKTVEQLIETLENDESPLVKIECIKSLMLMKDKRATEALTNAVKDSNYSVKTAAALALGTFHTPLHMKVFK